MGLNARLQGVYLNLIKVHVAGLIKIIEIVFCTSVTGC